MDTFTVLRWVTIAALSLVLVLWWWRLRRRSIQRSDRWIILAVGGIQVASMAVYYAMFWHQLAAGQTTSLLLQNGAQYVWRHALTDLTSLTVGWLVALALLWFVRWFFLMRGRGMMIDGTDGALLVVAAAAAGWPGIFLMLAATFVLSILAMIVLVILRKKTLQDRLIITPYIIPATVFVLIFSDWLLAWTHLAKIGF